MLTVMGRCLQEFCPSLQNMCWQVNLELRHNTVMAGTYHKRILFVITSHLELHMFNKNKGPSVFCEVIGNLSGNLHPKQYLSPGCQIWKAGHSVAN